MAYSEEEKKSRAKAYYIANREAIIARVCARARAKSSEVQAYKKAWHVKNRETILAKKRAYAQENRESISAKAKAAYRANPGPRKARAKAFSRAHPEKVKAAQQSYRKANADTLSAYKRSKHLANRDRFNEISRKYYHANAAKLAPRRREYGKLYRSEFPEKHAEIEARRRARKKNTATDGVDYRLALERANGLCGLCRNPFDLLGIEFDHIIPLSRGGTHTQANIQATHARCNRAKGSRVTA